MTANDRVAAGMHEIEREFQGPPPARLVKAAREAAPAIKSSHRTRARRRAGIGTSVLALLVAGAFTAPGRAATEWVADLAGIGDEPTLDHPYDKPGAVVIDKGRLSDGTPYEIVARVIDPADRFPSNAPNRGFDADPTEAPQDLREFRTGASLCFGIDLPTDPTAEQDSFCAGRSASAGDTPPFTTYGAQLLPSGPGMLFGIVEDPNVAEVRVVASRSELEPVIPSKLLSVDPAFVATVGREDPIRFFRSPVDGTLVNAVNDDGLKLYAVGVDDAGRELSRVVILRDSLATSRAESARSESSRDRSAAPRLVPVPIDEIRALRNNTG